MPMPSILISSVAAGIAADMVAVLMSIDMVLDVADMSMLVAVAVSGWLIYGTALKLAFGYCVRKLGR